MKRIRTAALAAASVLTLGLPAFAADPQGTTAATSDAPMPTSNPSPTTAQQIQAFIDSSPAAAEPDPNDELPLPDRKVHGEVSVSVGNHGYRSAYARSDMPVGKTGTLSIAVGESRGRGVGYGYGPGYGYGGYGYGRGYGYGSGRQQSLAIGLDFSKHDRDRYADDRYDCDRHDVDASRAYPADDPRLCRPEAAVAPGRD